MTIHVRSDANPVTSGGMSSRICNCACTVCLSGRCCMDPQPKTPSQPLVTWASTTPGFGIACQTMGHSFAVFDPTRIYCQRCGEFRNAERPKIEVGS